MSATSMHTAVWRQAWQVWRHAWQVRRGGPVWERPWLPPLVLAVPLLALVAFLPAQTAIWLALLGVISLYWLWWLQVEGLVRQNRPASARLVPGHAATLRLNLLCQGLLVALAAAAVLALAFGPRLQWLWLAVPIVVLTAWLQREPWLWALPVLAGPWFPGYRLAAAAAALPLGWQSILLVLSGGLLAACIGDGGPLHRWHDARCQRWARARQAQRDGRGAPPAALGPIGRAWLRLFDWPKHAWRRRLLRQGAAAPLPARLDLGLDFGGRWATLTWILLVVSAGTVVAVLLTARQNPDVSALRFIDAGRFGLCIGLFTTIGSTLNGRLDRLWGRRREQALLSLLPGLPAGDITALERRWRLEYLLLWAVATVVALAITSQGSPGSLDYAAACAGGCLPLVWWAQHRQRRLRDRPGFSLPMLAPLAIAGLAWPVQQAGVPAWLSLGTGVVLWALCAVRRDDRVLRLPVGR